MAHPAVIFPEADVENPMQAVLDAPVPADGLGQHGRIVVAAGEEVADLGLGLAGAVDAADRLDRQQRAEIGQGSRIRDQRLSAMQNPATSELHCR